ncbi:MAG TPA: GNAT family N-acetyltransferase [Holophagaceae bacterium]|nr:GNAT family N-acetyltransferase [Holophagaceae bacterium]
MLETSRLHLQPLTLDDAPFILRLLNEPSFLQHIGDKGVRDLEGAKGYLTNGPMASYARHGHGLMAVVLKAAGGPIGMCGLLKRDNLEHPDLGYAFLPEFWSKGYAMEAAAAVLDHGSKSLGFRTLLAIVSQDNAASIRLLGKLGFAFTRLEAMYPNEPKVAVYTWAAV